MQPRSITVVDYGVGNVGSIVNMIDRIGEHAHLSREPEDITLATHIILPGVGAFDTASERLSELGLVDALQRAVQSGAFLLGICLGMQLLLDGSDEGVTSGLGLIPGRCKLLPSAVSGEPLLVPHMGWNKVFREATGASLPSLGQSGSRYYFSHSYVASPIHEEHVLGKSIYGIPFVSAVAVERVSGVQFHPEKSHRHGMAILGDFLEQGDD